ncbi:MAG: Fic family protein [Clostridia bacterium]|nr:Fic family protein [Clostridia bacterium]
MDEIKISLRFFDGIPVRSVWDDVSSKWFMCASDVCAAITDTKNPRVYWATVKRRNFQLFANCKQLKMKTNDGKSRSVDVIGEKELNSLFALVKSDKKRVFKEWLESLGSSVDEKSKIRAYELFESGFIRNIEVGTVRGLQQIHAYIFDGLYDFAGQIRTKNISKKGFAFASALYLRQTLETVEKMPEDSLENIVDKYIEMNVAHPFLEGNGRSTRIWLDMILKKNLGVCVDWSLIEKKDYLSAMEKSPLDGTPIFRLIKNALTDRINDRELFIKGIDYSYYYETEE